jgi:ABC-type lipoprotein export system ATPase subunit
MTLIRVQGLHKTYRLGRVSVPVLRGVDLEVRPGETVAILGASGSGKSTLLHLMGGLDRPDRSSSPKGLIEFQGRDVTRFSAGELDRYRRKRVGFVFQFYHLLPELTLLENVMLGGMIGTREPGLRERATALIESVGLGDRLRHRPAELSGGERQRTAIARALVTEPDLLLADEPTGNLDEKTGEEVLEVLGRLRDGGQHSMVVVTHSDQTARRADRVVHLRDGRIVGGAEGEEAA